MWWAKGGHIDDDKHGLLVDELADITAKLVLLND